MKTRTVAVIGAGPGGLAAARYLKSEGLEPVVFERAGRIGGQWSGDPECSGVWPGLRTNTSRILTAFSDFPHSSDSPTYLTSQAIGEYLQRYAELFDLLPHIRVSTPARNIQRNADGGWLVQTDLGEECYAHVVIASGRYNYPSIPDVRGLLSFAGSAGVKHAFYYKQPQVYRGLRVLIAGCGVSSLEIASDLAMMGAARVMIANRKQRYVLPKLVKGVPIDHLAFTRYFALEGESLPESMNGSALKQFVLDVAGSPEQFGAPKPSDDVAEAGISRSQYFLPFVAEGRITTKPWIDRVDGKTVHFEDGSAEIFDAIIFGTGYQLRLPFLSEEISRVLNIDSHHLDLYNHTFHPDLPGLAFLGLYELVGPYFPVLELQARWIAYTFSGAQAAPSREEMHAGIAAYQARRGGSQSISNHVAAVLFARAAGVEPDLTCWSELARPLLFGPLTPSSFRMCGRDQLQDAPERFASEARVFGCVPTNELTPSQCAQLRRLAGARSDTEFTRYVERVTETERAAGKYNQNATQANSSLLAAERSAHPLD